MLKDCLCESLAHATQLGAIFEARGDDSRSTVSHVQWVSLQCTSMAAPWNSVSQLALGTISWWKMRMNRAIAIGTDVRLQRKPKVRRNLKRLLHIRNMQDTKHAEIRNYSHCGFTSFQTKCNVSTLPCGSYEPDKHMLSDINITRSRSANQCRQTTRLSTHKQSISEVSNP